MNLNKILTFILVFVLMITCVSINAIADDNVDYLDLESTETYKDSKDLDQNYTFTQTGDVTYTDTTKVKLTWTINDIEATYTSHKTWDPANLQWTEAKKDINVTHSGASFTLTNYSSKKVIGTVSFKVESALNDTFTSATFDANNGKEIDTVVNDDYTIDETKKTNIPSNTITATLAFNSDKFADLSATTSATKYGTYTVTIKQGKLDQTAPTAPSIDNATVTSTTVTLTAASAGQGDTKYGYSTTNDAKTIENWQEGVEFTSLTPYTTYYFFAKYVGNDNYKEAVSEGTEIKTLAGTFTINTPTLSSNVTANKNNPTTIKSGETATLIFTAAEKCLFASTLPENAVSGASIKSWDASTGTLVIENATDNVDISLLLPVCNSPYFTNVSDAFYAITTGDNLTYQWYFGSYNKTTYDLTNATLIAGATSNSLSYSVIESKSFFYVVTNEYGSVYSPIQID